MLTFILPILISLSAHAANYCQLEGKCKMCNKCEIHYRECVLKARKDKYAINQCDFLLAVCKRVNKCDGEEDKAEKGGDE